MPRTQRLRPHLLPFVSSSKRMTSTWQRGLRMVAHAILLLLLCVTGSGQQHSHGSKPPAEPAPSGEVSPELETFGRIIAVQARVDQVGYFNSAIASTDRALHESRQLQHLGAAVNDIATVNAISLQLRDSLDDVEHYNGRLLASFSKPQQSGLKKLTRQMHKSYSNVAHDARTMQQLMEPGKIVPDRLATGAVNLEKTLSDFRTDEIRLGREMGIQTK